jgi:Ca-activated chloride channel family protein
MPIRRLRASFSTAACGLAHLRLVALCLLIGNAAAAEPLEPKLETAPTCKDDAMIVFDASGSMAGTDLNTPLGPRIAKVKTALGKVLPSIAAVRRIGLLDYGPGPYNRCDNIELQLRPTPNAAKLIMDAVDKLAPAGRTPLTAAVRQAAEVLDFPAKAGTIVVVTDGEETCGGDPCALAKSLHEKDDQLTVHVIGYRSRESSEGLGFLQVRCLADTTGGLYIPVETTDDLVAALNKTLGCPEISELRRGPRVCRAPVFGALACQG